MSQLTEFLLKNGVDESLANELAALPRSCKSFDEFQELLGPPDKVYAWDSSLEQLYNELKASGKRVEKWRKKYHYSSRFAPVRVTVCEMEETCFRLELGIGETAIGGSPRE